MLREHEIELTKYAIEKLSAVKGLAYLWDTRYLKTWRCDFI